jgi:hypothetical protein
VETFTAFLVSVVVGARRFAQAGVVKANQALQAVLGLKRFPTDDTIRNLFKRFTQGAVYRFYSGGWQLGRLEPWSEGWSLDFFNFAEVEECTIDITLNHANIYRLPVFNFGITDY